MCTFGHKQRAPQGCLQIGRLTFHVTAQHVLNLHYAKNIIKTTLTYRKTGVTAIGYPASCFFGRVIDVEPDYLSTRRHQCTGTQVAQAKYMLYHIPFCFFKRSGFHALLDQDVNLFLCYRRLGNRSYTQYPEYCICRNAQQMNRRGGYPG
ncbi:Uncharacterised protein [uncultured archaeon]|nr:Uncharacterised protein [uncultured archaeon]